MTMQPLIDNTKMCIFTEGLIYYNSLVDQVHKKDLELCQYEMGVQIIINQMKNFWE